MERQPPSPFRPRRIVIPVRVTGQALDYLHSLPPQPRYAIRVTVKGLAKEQGEINLLTEELEGLYRLRLRSNQLVIG